MLERFVRRNDPDAFRVLIDRHGPMVLAVCRTVLREQHDAEDAFQTTFLALARRAGTIKHTGQHRPMASSSGTSRCPAGAAPGVPKSCRRADSIGLGTSVPVPAARSFVHSAGPRRSESPARALPSARGALLPGWKDQRGGRGAVAVPGRDGQGAAFEGPTTTARPLSPPWPGSLRGTAGSDFLTKTVSSGALSKAGVRRDSEIPSVQEYSLRISVAPLEPRMRC